MLKIPPASESRPLPTSWVRKSEPFTSQTQNFKEDDVNNSLLTFPTDQVPQPVTRDAIVTTTMAASTDFRGSACLPLSTLTVQAQVFISTVTGCAFSLISCDYDKQVDNDEDEDEDVDEEEKVEKKQQEYYYYYNYYYYYYYYWKNNSNSNERMEEKKDEEERVAKADNENVKNRALRVQWAGAGPVLAPWGAPSVITSSCLDVVIFTPASKASITIFTSLSGNYNYYYYNLNYRNIIIIKNNKTQSVRITSSSTNNNCLLFVDCNCLVTVPNTISTNIKESTQRKLMVEAVVTTSAAVAAAEKKNNKKKTAIITSPLCHPRLIPIPASSLLSSLPPKQPPTPPLQPQLQPPSTFKINHNNNYRVKKSLVLVNVYNKDFYGALKRTSTDYIPSQPLKPLLQPSEPSTTQANHNKTDNKGDNNNNNNNNVNNNGLERRIQEENHKPHSLQSSELKLSNEKIENTNHSNDTSYISLDRLIALSKRTRLLEQLGLLPKRLGLLGGGESSLSTGTTGWGTPPSTNPNNNNGWGGTSSSNQNNANNQQNWNNNQNRNNSGGPSGPGAVNSDGNSNNKTNTGSGGGNQVVGTGGPNQPPQSSQATGWQQNKNAGSQGLQGPQNVSSTSVTSQAPVTSTNPQVVASVTPTTSTKQQLEQLNNMREALFAQDGWGGQHVNQDTNWDIPSSPEPQIKMDGSGPPQWKPTVNNGTDLWEVNLRNGGQPPPQPAQKTPWGHTPSTNIGGTWGEDDDVTDSSNVWTGVPNNQQQWGTNGAMWSGPKKDTEWGNSGWDPRNNDPRSGAGAGLDPREMRIDPRDIRSGASEAMRMLDPRDQMRLVNSGEIRGDPRGGITGRLNGAQTEAMWGQPGPHGPQHHLHQQAKMVGPGGNNAGVNQWAGPPPKEPSLSGKPTGWEEPSPPSQRRNMLNYDDGTSLWGNPNQQGRGVAASAGNLSHWKEIPTGPSASMSRGNGTMGLPPGMSRTLKPDTTTGGTGAVWGTAGVRNGTAWDESTHSVGGGAWDEPSGWPTKPSNKPTGLWPEPEIEWHKPTPKPLSKELVWNSKQFRLLVDMGYKKEDAESALRAREMNLEDALDLLSLQRGTIDGWRSRHDDHFDHQPAPPFPTQRFPPQGPTNQLPFPPNPNPGILNSINSINTNTTANNPPNLTSINNMSPAIVHKMLNHGPSNQFNNSTSSRNLQNTQPSTQQLRMLVQQIQMAVQAGYLNHQILNQPLAPQTLILLNQLLQQIKNLQQLMSQHQMAQNQGVLGKPNSQMVLQCSVLITKTKQQITNLQNQIAAQQAIYVKQQHVGPGGGGAGAGAPGDFFKGNMHDSINALQGNFGELGIKEAQGPYQGQQSRLNQWKLPALEKDGESGGEFSRAPGPVTKPLAPSHSSPNLNPLGLGQNDGPWSTGRSAETSGWPDASGGSDPVPPDVNKEPQWPTSAQPSLTDLVPEFEPGKPWKGNQIKSIEDDPSITPGSVVRSPLSLATIKDSEIFNTTAQPSKVSPPGVSATDTIQPLSLSSSTWSFNPPTTTPSAFTRMDDPLGKIASSKATWGDNAPPPTAVTSELWGVPMTAKPRGPPPGLAKGASNLSLTANGWNNTSVSGGRSSWGSQAGNWGSPWLLLRNLTAQIDGSTLRTLCMQHGPLQSFHLYLHQGFALVKYSSREEATKAQTALNNCVLGNTTILAESPADSDAQSLLQQLAPQQSASTGAWRTSGAKPAADTWNTGWPTNTSGSLWGAAPMDSADPARATPSSLNSFLPGDLLGV